MHSTHDTHKACMSLLDKDKASIQRCQSLSKTCNERCQVALRMHNMFVYTLYDSGAKLSARPATALKLHSPHVPEVVPTCFAQAQQDCTAQTPHTCLMSHDLVATMHSNILLYTSSCSRPSCSRPSNICCIRCTSHTHPHGNLQGSDHQCVC